MKNQITYTEHNGLYYPDLALPEQTNYPLGKYANLRLDFIKKHRRGTYTPLLTEGRLNEHLHEIDLQAHEMLDTIIEIQPQIITFKALNIIGSSQYSMCDVRDYLDFWVIHTELHEKIENWGPVLRSV